MLHFERCEAVYCVPSPYSKCQEMDMNLGFWSVAVEEDLAIFFAVIVIIYVGKLQGYSNTTFWPWERISHGPKSLSGELAFFS